MATLSQLQTYAALRFRDQSGVIVSSDDWTSYLNDAYNDMVTRCTWFPFNEKSSSMTVTAGLRSGTLPTDCWQVLAVFNSTDQMPMIPTEGRDQIYSEYPQQTEQGTPVHYRIFGNALLVYPLPSATTTFVIDYVVRPVDLTSGGSATDATPVFPPQYHTTIVNGALALAYKDDGNLQQADAYQKAFDAEIESMRRDLLQPRIPRYYEPIDTAYYGG